MKLLVGTLVRSGWTWFALCGLMFTLATNVKDPSTLVVIGIFFGLTCVGRIIYFVVSTGF